MHEMLVYMQDILVFLEKSLGDMFKNRILRFKVSSGQYRTFLVHLKVWFIKLKGSWVKTFSKSQEKIICLCLGTCSPICLSWIIFPFPRVWPWQQKWSFYSANKSGNLAQYQLQNAHFQRQVSVSNVSTIIFENVALDQLSNGNYRKSQIENIDKRK